MGKKVIIITASVLTGIVAVMTVLCLIFVDDKNVQYEYFKINSGGAVDAPAKIVHLSDLHFPKIKVNIDKMVARISAENPDAIAITGDLIDKKAKVASCGVFEFIDKIKIIAPIYYIAGNHEEMNKQSPLLYDYLNKSGAKIYSNSFAIDRYGVWLFHKPQFFQENEGDVVCEDPKPDDYVPINYGLILAGHIHGGQVRVFGIGLLSPDTFMFPKYTSGMYRDHDTRMIVSRGLGNSIFPFRFNNRPHVPIIQINP